MKSNSSKNRKANVPSTSDNSKSINGVTKPTSNNSSSKKKTSSRKINKSQDFDFFKNEVEKVDKEFYKNNLDLTSKLINAEVEAFNKSISKEFKDYEKEIAKSAKKLGLVGKEKELFTKKYLANQKQINTDKRNEFYVELAKKYGLIEEKKDKTDKEPSWISTRFDKLKDNFGKVLDKNNKSIKGALLGSLNLLTAPLEDFFGFDTMDVFKKALHIGDKSKKNPTKSDVQKKGDAGSLLIVNSMEELLGKQKKKQKKQTIFTKIIDKLKWFKVLPSLIRGFIKSIPILGTALRGFGLMGKAWGKNKLAGGNIMSFMKMGASKTAFKAISPLAIITSIIMMVVDGIKGIFKSKEWGVPKGSAFVGGLLGGVGKGFKGAFANMGKWALMGFGIGCIFTPIGGLIGGLIGAVLGGILGFIGGEKISKFLNELVQKVFIEPFKRIGDFWKDDDRSIWNKIASTIGGIYHGLYMIPINIIMFTYNKIKGLFDKHFNTEEKKQEREAKKKLKEMRKQEKARKKLLKKQEKQEKRLLRKQKINSFMTTMWDNITKTIKDFFKNPLLFIGKGTVNYIDKLTGAIWDFIGGFIEGAFNIKVISWKDFKTQISNTIQNIIDSIFEIWGKVWGVIKDFFDLLFHDPLLVAKTFLPNYSMSDAFEEYAKKKESKVEKVNDAIIKKDGTIIRTSQDDNLIATKNDPTKIMSMNDFNSDRLKDVVNSAKNIQQIDYSNQLGTMIDLLNKLLNKEVVTVNNNEQSLSDLKVLAGGFNVAY